MQVPFGSNYPKRNLLADSGGSLRAQWVTDPSLHEGRVRADLRLVGLRVFGLLSSESRYLPNIIHDDEQIGGAIFGRSEGTGMILVATDNRLILLDKRPQFVNEDEIGYEAIRGISYSHAGPTSTVTLHGHTRDYSIATFNRRSAEQFVAYVESRGVSYYRPSIPVHSPPVFSRYGQPRRLFRR